MKCHILISRTNEKNFYLLSAEFAYRMVKVNIKEIQKLITESQNAS